jgi:oxalate decarboxylase
MRREPGKERPENERPEKEKLTRRGFLGAGSAALAAAGMLAAKDLAAQEQETPQKAKTNRSASDPGPTNSAIDAANPDSNNPLISDAGGVQTFKYPFSFAHKRLHEGGWSREVTVRELPVSKSLAGVNMRLTAGGIRELHWPPRSGPSCCTAARASPASTRRARASSPT